MRERMTAIRVNAVDIVNGDFGNDNGPRIISPSGVELRRVMLVGNIVEAQYYEKKPTEGKESFVRIILDDGSETVRVQAWGAEADLMSGVRPSKLALIIGKVQQYKDDVFVKPETIKELDDANIMTVHKLDRMLTILRNGGDVYASTEPDVSLDDYIEPSTGEKSSDSVSSSLPRLQKRIYEFVCENDSLQGVSNTIIADALANGEMDKVKIDMELIELVEKDMIYEIQTGVYRPT